MQPDSCDTTQNDGENAMTESMELENLSLDPRQALAYEEWQRLSRDDGAPLQGDFRPDRIARALPAAMLLHVERDGPDVRFRQKLEGRFVTLAFGEGSGGDIEDLYTDEHLHDIMPRYLEAAVTGDTAMTECSAPMRNNEPFSFTRLILPFCGPDGAVNRLLVVFHFDPVALARLPGPVKIRREVLSEAENPATRSFLGMAHARQAG